MSNVLDNHIYTGEQNKKRMSDNKLQTEAKLLSNNILKDVFQELHNAVVNNIDTSCVLDKLFSAKVITHIDMHELEFIKKPLKQCRRLLIILHKVQNPRTFIELREAIANQESYGWFVEIIDEKYNLLTSPSIQPQPQVNGVLSNPSLKENTRLLEENAKQKLNNERISKDNATLTTENSKLLEDIKSLKDDNEQLCLERSDYENKMVKIVDELKKELASVRKSQSKSYMGPSQKGLHCI
jgi:Caspase recruitment domain